MATKEFTLPDVGEGVAEGELVSWLVSPGDAVTEDQPVAEVETDKALVEVPSPYNGTVKELLAEEGEIVPVGNVIITFDVPDGDEATDAEPAADAKQSDADPDTEQADSGSEPAADADSDPDTDPAADDPSEATESADAEPGDVSVSEGRTFAPPSVRRLARELGLSIAAVDGSGPTGRVTEADVRAHADGTDGPPATDPGDAAEPEDERKQAVTRRQDGSSSAASSAASQADVDAADRDRTLAVPATRKVAREEGVEIDAVPTDLTREGEAFVTAEQVREFAAATRASGEAAESAAPTQPAAGTATDTPGAEIAGPQPEETVPYRGVRRTIGKQMETSKFTAPHVTHHDTAEVSELVAARERLKPKAEARDVSLTYMPFVMKAIVAGLKAHPSLNSELRADDEEIAYKKYYNLGIAVATDAGLMVPVVKRVDEKGVFELAAEVRDLAERARNREISPDEMQGGTFTITNFGAIGGEYATPIINYPETAILGLGAIEQRPVVKHASELESGFFDEEDGHEVVARPTLPLSLSIDHRVIDGAVAAEFVNTVMEHLESPMLLITE